jgi:hypothetical protein
MKLNKEEQIDLLCKVRELICKRKEFLCIALIVIMREHLGVNIYSEEIPDYIPLFTFKNAIRYANANENAKQSWWKFTDDYNREDRLKFIDWMIEELSK